MDVDLKVDGTWLKSIGVATNLEITHRAQGGGWQVSWEMSLPPGIQPPALRVGATVDVEVGALVWAGELTDPDWDEGKFTADGWCRQGEEVLAVTSAWEPAGSATAALSAAVARGSLGWSVDGSVTTTVPYEPTEVVTVAAKLDELADLVTDSAGVVHRWRVTPAKRLVLVPDPTTPALFVPPGVVDIGATTESQTTRLIASYTHTDGTVKTVTATTGGTSQRVVERRLKLDAKGAMTPAAAQTLVGGFARRLGSDTRLSSGIEVAHGDVLDDFGSPVCLSALGSVPQMIRLQSTTDPRNGAGQLDFVIGETVWKVSEGKAQITPVDAVTSDLATLVEKAGGEMA